MVQTIIYLMIYLGSALMVFNIYGFVRFAHDVRKQKAWDGNDCVLYVPVVLLVLFLLGYLTVGFFGKPDLIVSGILFGGSVFVFVVYRLLSTIMERVFRNQEIEARLMAAEETNRAKAGFLASISHEMRTPMNIILGLDTLALKNADLPAPVREQLEKADASAKHLSGLIDNILTIQEEESDETAPLSERFSLKETLEQICAQISFLCEQKGLDFQFSFSKCANRDYAGDAARLRRALMCILENAVKFTDAPGSVHFCVLFEKEQDAYTRLRFVVSDTGIGIDEAFLPKLFQPLTQENQSFTNRFGGSGMGLAVADRLVQRMGGTLEVEGWKGTAATFTVAIPLLSVGGDPCTNCEGCRPDQSELCANCKGCSHVAPAKAEAAAVDLAGRRVLIVEDVDVNAEIVADLLELEDVESERAENGQIAVEMVEQAPENYYDAILMDLRMPVMDGLEATRRIRALKRADVQSVPIIALTANAFESDIEASVAAGMNEHLAKPADSELLYGALRRWIGASQRKTEGGKSRD